jgi:hypothetical protein
MHPACLDWHRLFHVPMIVRCDLLDNSFIWVSLLYRCPLFILLYLSVGLYEASQRVNLCRLNTVSQI